MTPRSRPALALAPLCALLGLSQCSSDPKDLDEVFAELARAMCEQRVRCGEPVPETPAHSCADRVVFYLKDLRRPRLAVAARLLAGGSAKIDVDAVERCRAGIVAASCNDEFPFPDECNGIVRGTRPTGDPCTSPYECASNRCRIEQEMCPGTCEPPAPIPRNPPPPMTPPTVTSPIGGPCGTVVNGSVLVCEPTAFCGSGQTCRAYVATGGACANVNESYCARGHECVAGRCERRRVGAVGEACGSPAPHVRCDEFLRSTCSADRCVVVGTGEVGSACVGPGRSGPWCNDGLYCDYPPAGGTPTCRPRWADGSPCSDSEACESGVCTNGRCGLPLCSGMRVP